MQSAGEFTHPQKLLKNTQEHSINRLSSYYYYFMHFLEKRMGRLAYKSRCVTHTIYKHQPITSTTAENHVEYIGKLM